MAMSGARKVAIVGRAEMTYPAPFDDDEWDIWSVPWQPQPRCDRYFEIHTQRWVEVNRATDGVMYGASDWEKMPGLWCHPTRAPYLVDPVVFPMEIMQALPVNLLTGQPFDYLENSVAYMMMLAIHEDRPGIGLYGVHMKGRPDLMAQNASVTWLIGLAQGRGIPVGIPPTSPLLASRYISGYPDGELRGQNAERK